MNDLIWYSIPGAIVIMPFIQTHSDSISSEKWLIGIIIVGIPVVGFIIHQMWRTIYESFGGFKSNRRKVIRAIIEHDNWGIKFKEDAFLVWELTFYSKHIDQSFRDHNRGAWHYIMSFYSCTLASVLGIIYLTFNCKHSVCENFSSNISWIFILLLLAILFLIKAKLTGSSIENQEVGILRTKEKHFKETVDNLNRDI